jgi:hypothetical protein
MRRSIPLRPLLCALLLTLALAPPAFAARSSHESPAAVRWISSLIGDLREALAWLASSVTAPLPERPESPEPLPGESPDLGGAMDPDG